MAKYAKYQPKSTRHQREIHPIWRGIGCIMMVIVPLMAYGLAVLFTPPIEATGLLPRELFQPLRLPDWAFETPVLREVAVFFAGVDNLGALLLFFFIFLLVLSGVFSMLYAGIYQAVGPARYTAFDAPPPNYKGKRYKR